MSHRFVSRGHLVWRSPAGVLGRELVVDDEVDTIAPSGPRTMLVLGWHAAPAGDYGPPVTEFFEVSSTGAATRPIQLTSGNSTPAAAAAGGSGAAVVAWGESRRLEGWTLRARTRARTGRRFSQPMTVGATTAEDLPAALGPHGESAVLWNVRAHGRTEVRVRIRRPGGRGFGPPVTLGGSESVAHIDAAFSPTGRLYAIWGTHDAGQELNRTYNVYAAFVDPGARRASARQALDLGDRVPGILWARVSLVATPSGGAVAGWTGVHTDPAPLPARVAAAGPSGRFGAPQTLDPQAALSDLALSPTDGSVAAT